MDGRDCRCFSKVKVAFLSSGNTGEQKGHKTQYGKGGGETLQTRLLLGVKVNNNHSDQQTGSLRG